MKEKARAEAFIKEDSQNWSQLRLERLRGQRIGGETRKQKHMRQMLYLEHLVTSKNELMKRKLLDLIDNIYNEEKEQLSTDMDKCNEEMKRWEQKSEEPVNFDVVLLKRLQEMEQDEQR